jgi:hypothetical protein
LKKQRARIEWTSLGRARAYVGTGIEEQNLTCTTRMHCTRTAQHTSVRDKEKVGANEGNLFLFLFFGAEVVISTQHISSAPKGESSSTVELQIGGAAALEWV